MVIWSRLSRRRRVRVGLAVLLMIATACLGEFLYNLPLRQQADYQYLESGQVETDGFRLVDGVYVSERGGAVLRLHFEEQFVDKLYYEFEYEGQLHAEILVGDYTTASSSKSRKIEDHNNHLFHSSTVNIHKLTDEITICMPADAEHVNIRAMALNNTGNYSVGRMVFHFLVTGMVLLLAAILWGEHRWKAEEIFLAVSVSAGLLMIFTLPVHKVGLDEEIHFGRAYYLFDTLAGKETVTVTPAMDDLIRVSLNNWPYSIPQSEEEQKQEEAYWNGLLSWDSQQPSEEYQQDNYRLQMYSFSYLPQALMIKLGQLLQLDFTMIYRMGRMGNLILYCLVIFFAIRHMPFGKRIMLVLALMPTAMFSAVTYTYDATVTAFSFLGIAYLLPELLDNGKKLSYKSCAIFIGAFVLASLPKPVYIPMLGLALCIPSSRFASRRACRMFRGVVLVVFFLVLSTFALPPLFNPQQQGDARGGDTSVGRQLRYVFAHPFAYAGLLLDSLREKFFSFTFGYRGLGQMGHLAGNADMITTAMLTVGTVLTDHREKDCGDLSTLRKGIALLLSFVTLCLVWSALYLSFTPVGADIIRGVQGRYYLPVTMLFLPAFRSKWICNRIPERLDLALVSGCSILLLFTAMYGAVIINTY